MTRLLGWAAATGLRGLWAPCGVLLAHVVAARVGVYARWPGFDMPMHFLGGVAIAFLWHTASLQGSIRGLLGPWRRLNHALLVFGWTAVAAVVWEFYEFLSDRFTGTWHQGGSLPDTLLDLFLGLLGGGMWALAASLGSRGPRDPAGETLAE